MFDGNHRTRRSRQNLGGKSAAKSKQSILETSKRRRQSRAIEQAKQQAATTCQRWVRGVRARVHSREALQQQTAASATTRSWHETSRLWNVRFASVASVKQEDAMLLEYATQLQSQQQHSTFPPPLMHRIVRATFRSLLRKLHKLDGSDAGNWSAPYQAILSFALGGAASASGEGTVADATPLWHKLGFAAGYRLAVQVLFALQQKQQQQGTSEALENTISEAVRRVTPQDSVPGRALLVTLQLITASSTTLVSCSSVDLEPLLQVLNTASTAATTASDDITRSLVALVQEQVQTHAATILTRLLQQQQSSNNTLVLTILPLLVKLYPASPRLQLLTGRAVRGEPLQPQPAPVAAAAAAPPARQQQNDDDDGSSDDDDDDDMDHRASQPQQYKTATTTTSSSASAKRDYLTLPKLDRLWMDQYTAWRRQHEQDELMQQSMSSSDTSTDMAAAQQLGDATVWIQWAQQLQALSSSVSTSTTTTQQQQRVQDATACWLQGCTWLLQQAPTGLKPRQSASSPFLAKLAFHETSSTRSITELCLVEWLWTLVQQQQQQLAATAGRSAPPTIPATLLQAWSVFCDVFSHRLIAQYDDQFLQQYTDAYDQNNMLLRRRAGLGKRTCIAAKQVIVDLRDQLYDLYWNRPVRASQVAFGVASAGSTASSTTSSQQQQPLLVLQDSSWYQTERARLLVTGTKLWTALYERWSRLMRETPFCDETCWIFSNLAIQLEQSVARAGQRQPNNDAMEEDNDAQQQHDAMDVDDDDDDDDHDEAMDAADVLAESFSDPKIARLLTSIPQALPFDRRFKLFQSLINNDKVANQADDDGVTRAALLHMMRGGDQLDLTPGRVKVEIRRGEPLYSDSMQALNHLGSRLKRRVQVSFLNQHGAAEAGIDGGGVFKEFIDDLIRDAFRSIDRNSKDDSDATAGPPHRLFDVTPLEMLAVNTSLPKTPEVLSHYEFLGRVLGKAVYESILVDPQFSFPFLKSFLGQVNSMGDMRHLDPELHRNFLTLLSLTDEELKAQDLDFEITLKDEDTGKTRNVELIQGGRNVAVTKQNVIQYVHLFAYHRLNIETAAPTKAFLRGFRDLIPATWVRLFNPYELQKIISGDDSVRGINVAGLKKVMKYASGYHPSQPVVQWFWDIVENEMTDEQQRKFLKFMTSCSRQPLLGFGVLDPPPCLQQIRIAANLRETDNLEALAKQTPLPTASTCMNLLKLPNYPSKALMKWKLLAAIEADAGFELT